MYMSTLSLSSDTCQKRASDPITDGCEPPCGCCELNSGPQEEQSVLLPAEPSPQPPKIDFLKDLVLSLCTVQKPGVCEGVLGTKCRGK